MAIHPLLAQPGAATGSLLALAGRQPDESGIGNTPGNNWSYLWIAIATAIFLTCIPLALRRLRQ